MPIRDVDSGVTGGIGPVRYVEKGVTVNIPVAYVVESGKTVLVYQEADDNKVYTPTEDTYYFYNRGTMSDVLGGFKVTGDGNSIYSEQPGYLSIKTPKRVNCDITLTSKHIMDLTAYKTARMEFAYVNADTGEELTYINVAYIFRIDGTGNGIYNVFGLMDSPIIKLAMQEGFWADSVMKICPTVNQPISFDDNAELRIYSIYITKTY